MHNAIAEADICLIAEGCYPYVRGGVSGWIHDLILSQPQHSFHIVQIVPEDMVGQPRYYDFPENVIASTVIPIRWRSNRGDEKLRPLHYGELKKAIKMLCMGRASLTDFERLIDLLAAVPDASLHDLLDSQEMWDELLSIYRESMPESSFLDYFWSMRALLGGLYSVLLTPLPKAKLYHTTCTGYAGLFAARAKIATGMSVILTEHGIYTNERRIEISSAEWLRSYPVSANLTIDRLRRELKDLWMDAFVNYSRICYGACDRIITLYDENQQMQREDGAPEHVLQVIPNGVNVDRFSRIDQPLGKSNETIAFVGRIVPVKDVKSYIRVVKELQGSFPYLKAYIIGPYDEDPEYFQECTDLVRYLALGDVIEFTGQVKLEDYLPRIDVMVLTSISEAQPLVVLEAGAAGVPVVSTNVGACAEMILGAKDEDPAFGPGGYVVPPSDTASMVKVIERLLTDDNKRRQYGKALFERVKAHYAKDKQDQAYRELYKEMVAWQA